MPIGMPGWPLLARCTASMESARMALASSKRVGIGAALVLREGRVLSMAGAAWGKIHSQRRLTQRRKAAKKSNSILAQRRKAAKEMQQQKIFF